MFLITPIRFHAVLTIAFIISVSNQASANCLTEIARFAEEICGKIQTSGGSTVFDVHGNLNAEVGGIIRRLAGNLGGGGSVNRIVKTYENVLREDLPDELQNVRGCKIKMVEVGRLEVCSQRSSNALETVNPTEIISGMFNDYRAAFPQVPEDVVNEVSHLVKRANLFSRVARDGKVADTYKEAIDGKEYIVSVLSENVNFDNQICRSLEVSEKNNLNQIKSYWLNFCKMPNGHWSEQADTSHNAENIEFDRNLDYDDAYRLAMQGDPVSQYLLGQMYDYGSGVSQNYYEAFRWYKQAADAGNVAAMNSVGNMYEYGQGVNQDIELAIYWYQRAAAGGNAWAKANLGDMYRKGKGVAIDYAKAWKLVREADALGSARAASIIGVMYLYGQGVSQNDIEAFRWTKKGADGGDDVALFNLGWMYDNGRGINQDFNKAAQFYLKAANLGDVNAILSIASMYEKGEGVSQNIAVATDWYQRAAKHGNNEAIEHLLRIGAPLTE